MPDTFPTKMRA